jgi:hypothetical protein
MSEEIDVSNDVEQEIVEKQADKSKKSKSKKSKAVDGEPKEVVMTFGKFKGKTVKSIISFDEKYAKWIYRQDFTKKFEDIYRVLNEHFGEK